MVTGSASNAFEPTMLVRRASSAKQPFLLMVDGPGAGERIELSKVVTTVGRPADCVVTCIRRLDEVAVRFTEGATVAQLNGNSLTGAPVLLKAGDLLQVGSRRYRFCIWTA